MYMCGAARPGRRCLLCSHPRLPPDRSPQPFHAVLISVIYRAASFTFPPPPAHPKEVISALVTSHLLYC